MRKNILIIDDTPSPRDCEYLTSEIKEVLNHDSHLDHEVNLTVINPNDYLTSNLSAEAGLAAMFTHLESTILTEKLDLFLCDFNLHKMNKELAFHIISHVRRHNKCCSIILYTGSPLKELTRGDNQFLAEQLSNHITSKNPSAEIKALKEEIDNFTEKELPSEGLFRLALESDITRIVTRPKYLETAIEVINEPSLLLRLENNLYSMGEEAIFQSTGFSLDGNTIGSICENIRKQTKSGIVFSNELIDLMSAHYAQLSS